MHRTICLVFCVRFGLTDMVDHATTYGGHSNREKSLVFFFEQRELDSMISFKMRTEIIEGGERCPTLYTIFLVSDKTHQEVPKRLYCMLHINTHLQAK